MSQTQTSKPALKEVELKLALLSANPAELEKQLSGLPVLAKFKASRHRLTLHNTYYDTPDHKLRGQRAALRLRRVGSHNTAQWLQTLKIGDSGNSALSQRGEWEMAVPGNDLALPALEATPWSDLDPQGRLFHQLAPLFVTSFERTSWTVEGRGGSAVEVSLDIGAISAGGKSMSLCELEIELLKGEPSALFEVAQQITHWVAVLPEHRSKAERGYALAEETLSRPVRAKPPALHPKMRHGEAAQCVLREMLCQFTANLSALRHTDDPEVLHQARVGWRRFRSAVRLFKPLIAPGAVPSWAPLKTLLTVVGELRDLDVARTETLPALARAYTAGDVSREENWQALLETLTQAASLKRKAICYAMDAPAVGGALLAITEWLEALPQTAKESVSAKYSSKTKVPLERWARKRIAHLHDQYKGAHHDADTLEAQHRVRIIAKRMRYGIEAFKPLLAKQQAKKWHQQASDVQTTIGASRDVAQAHVIVAGLQTSQELAEFVRGVAVGQAGSPSSKKNVSSGPVPAKAIEPAQAASVQAMDTMDALGPVSANANKRAASAPAKA